MTFLKSDTAPVLYRNPTTFVFTTPLRSALYVIPKTWTPVRRTTRVAFVVAVLIDVSLGWYCSFETWSWKLSAHIASVTKPVPFVLLRATSCLAVVLARG